MVLTAPCPAAPGKPKEDGTFGDGQHASLDCRGHPLAERSDGHRHRGDQWTRTRSNPGVGGRRCRVVLAARDEAKADRVITALHQTNPGAELEFQRIDTASLASVRSFATRWQETGRTVDLLLLDAGISNVPHREVTIDGLERQLATNYLGHFALTSLLLSHVTPAAGARIVAVSSLQNRRAELHLDDLQLTNNYSPMLAYGQSKLAMLMFALELDRRLQEAGSPVAAIAAHPGVAATGIVSAGGEASRFRQALAKRLFAIVGQTPAHGALPLLFAATAIEAQHGGYYGPDGRGERRGNPAPARIAPRAQDQNEAAQLWSISEELTGVA